LVLNSLRSGATRLVITSYFRNYLLRMNLTQPESLDDEGTMNEN
jgi:hypothetical protein